MSHLLFHLLFVFHHSRCDTASSLFASKCLGERYTCSLRSRGSWLGIPGFRIELCCCYHPLAWLCVVLCFWFCFFFGGHTHNDTQDVIVHVTLIAGSNPASLCFVWFGCGCGCFVCLVVFVLFFVLFS